MSNAEKVATRNAVFAEHYLVCIEMHDTADYRIVVANADEKSALLKVCADNPHLVNDLVYDTKWGVAGAEYLSMRGLTLSEFRQGQQAFHAIGVPFPWPVEGCEEELQVKKSFQAFVAADKDLAYKIVLFALDHSRNIDDWSVDTLSTLVCLE